ncbi:MAG: glutathione S-transferase [Synechococcaceae cyanobacterium]|nr:glutathione S-transferase [Synechococcaceae cyanobacterium]
MEQPRPADAMTLRLYGSRRSRAAIVRWYLEEKGIPYSLVELDVQAGEHRQEPFTRINPFAKMPALVDDALTLADGTPLALFESGAILLHLAEHYGEEFRSERGGGSAAGTSQGAVVRSLTAQWVLYANSTLATAMFQSASRSEDLERQLGVLDGLLAGGGSLVTGRTDWGAADCAVQAYLAYLPIFCSSIDLTPWPHVRTTIDATRARPAYQRANEPA